MNKYMRTRKVIAGVTLMAGLAGIGAGTASAQTTTPTQSAAQAGQGPMGHRGGRGAMHAEVLAQLVKAGTLTQAKADAIVKAFEAARPPKPALGTAPASRPDPAAAHKAVLDSLVKAGTVTQAEADAVQKAFEANKPQGRPQAGQQGRMGHRGGRGAMHAEVLGQLVKAGTLTQAKADAIVKAFEAARPPKPALGTASAQGTATASRPDPAAAHKAVLDSLVKAGTVTQAEADAVQKAFEANKPQGMPPMRAAGTGHKGQRGPGGGAQGQARTGAAMSSTHGS